MPGRFTALLRAHEDALTRAWVDGVYAERRTDLPALLSYRQLVEPLPEVFDELARLLDEAANEGEIIESARYLRRHTQVRFQQGCLLDEVARELMILRGVLHDFLWREGPIATDGDLWELRDALRRTNALLDELVAQALVTYAASLRPPVQTRMTVWPPARRRASLRDRDET
ncbi:MAG TPA: RsbRD N-terminal domain-containing protein [Pyrinomonadaceae bacterium]